MPTTALFGGSRLTRLAKVLVSLRVAIIVGIVVSARFAWLFSHAEKWDTPAQIPTLILCEIPFLACLSLLMTGEKSNASLRAGGLLFGTALSFCTIALPLSCDAGFTAWQNRSGYLRETERFIPVCVVTALWMLIVAWRDGKGRRAAFATYAAIGIGSFILVSFLIDRASVKGSGQEKENARFQQFVDPDFHLTAVAACLIRHHYLHPDQGFPTSLGDIQFDWNCASALSDTWALSRSRYWIHYIPVDDSYNGFRDFRLVSLNAEDPGVVAAIDRRGEVLKFSPPQLLGAQAGRSHGSAQTVDAGAILYMNLLGLQGIVRSYMAAHDPSNAPLAIDGIVDPKLLTGACNGEEGTSTDRVIGRPGTGNCYAVTYFAPSATAADSFAISLQCISYGNGCLRSYFLDYDGKIHATPEPRPATDQDPGLLPCEAALPHSVDCRDPVWTPSAQPSPFTFMRAKLAYMIHSTNW